MIRWLFYSISSSVLWPPGPQAHLFQQPRRRPLLSALYFISRHPTVLQTHSAPDLYPASHPNYCVAFFLGAGLLPTPTYITCLISSYLSLRPPRPTSCPPRVERDAHVVGVFSLGELHVPSCERALAEDGASPRETVSSCNFFSKALLSPSGTKKKREENTEKQLSSCEKFNSVLARLSPPCLLKTFSVTELFPASLAVLFQNFPCGSLLRFSLKICAVRGEVKF